LSDLLNISIKETNTQAAKPEFGNAQFNFRWLHILKSASDLIAP